mgnify:CR=1 FL=1
MYPPQKNCVAPPGSHSTPAPIPPSHPPLLSSPPVLCSCRFVDVQVDVTGHTLQTGGGLGGTLAGFGGAPGATFAGLGGTMAAFGGAAGSQMMVRASGALGRALCSVWRPHSSMRPCTAALCAGALRPPAAPCAAHLDWPLPQVPPTLAVAGLSGAPRGAAAPAGMVMATQQMMGGYYGGGGGGGGAGASGAGGSVTIPLSQLAFDAVSRLPPVHRVSLQVGGCLAIGTPWVVWH